MRVRKKTKENRRIISTYLNSNFGFDQEKFDCLVGAWKISFSTTNSLFIGADMPIVVMDSFQQAVFYREECTKLEFHGLVGKCL
jgi:hypothetical protein